METLPTLFLSHGAPNVVLYDLPARRFFDGLAATLPRPRAVLVASAHYESAVPALTASAAPATVHDFSGFEPELYAMRYPAPGDPALAARAADLVEDALGVRPVLDRDWGFDHGAWSPLCRLYPEADVPVVVLSVNRHAGAAAHLALGRALTPLREEGVLVLGSGSLTHNLARLAPPMTNDARAPWVEAFRDWVAARLEAGDEAALADYRAQAPHAADNHPSEEHFLPFHVALGAAGEGWRAARVHASVTFGTLAMDAWRFD